MLNYESSNLIDLIKKEDKKVLLEIYKFCFPQVRHYVLSNSGNILDAEDIFQDALVIIYSKIKKNELFLSSSFGTYLYGIARFLWLKEIERRRKYFGPSIEIADLLYSDINFLDDFLHLEKRKLILKHYFELNKECRKLLDLQIKDTPLSRITVLMGYSSDQYTRNRRASCKEKLLKAIWNNPRFKELKNDAYQQNTKIPRWRYE